MEDMFLSRAGKHEDVIEVDEHKLVQHVTENIVNQSLDHSRSVGSVRMASPGMRSAR